jgi:hypothetical protein
LPGISRSDSQAPLYNLEPKSATAPLCWPEISAPDGYSGWRDGGLPCAAPASLACAGTNAPRAEQGYAGITCESDTEHVLEELDRLLEQQRSDPPAGCEAALDACPALRMSF